MSFFQSISNSLRKGKESLLNEVSKYRNSSFMEAIVASAVIISTADGKITTDEKQKLLAYVQVADELKAFSSEDIIKVFNKIDNAYTFDAHIGKADAMKYVNRIKGNDEQARLVVRVAVAIANADGVFDDDEKKALGDICNELGLSASDFV